MGLMVVQLHPIILTLASCNRIPLKPNCGYFIELRSIDWISHRKLKLVFEYETWVVYPLFHHLSSWKQLKLARFVMELKNKIQRGELLRNRPKSIVHGIRHITWLNKSLGSY